LLTIALFLNGSLLIPYNLPSRKLGLRCTPRTNVATFAVPDIIMSRAMSPSAKLLCPLFCKCNCWI